jgi:hypothetical protein
VTSNPATACHPMPWRSLNGHSQPAENAGVWRDAPLPVNLRVLELVCTINGNRLPLGIEFKGRAGNVAVATSRVPALKMLVPKAPWSAVAAAAAFARGIARRQLRRRTP